MANENMFHIKNNADFRKILEDNTKVYEGPLSEIIVQTPDIFDLTCALLSAEQLSRKDRSRLSSVIAYLILPKDVFPEETFGTEGYIDDIYLCLYILKEIEQKFGIDMLLDYWDKDDHASLRKLLGEHFDTLEKKFKESILNDMKFYIGLE